MAPVDPPTLGVVTDAGAVMPVNQFTAGVVRDALPAGRILKPITLPETKQVLLRREASP
jgi:hypothetical protein